ncbi:hypothetical protein CHS0354_029537 [Potamilus streckersoni]|uniref:BZIP domain-containing protein n=1 Tax=Potamilus streckersoni TaxID=2493646 RepID=A0AAE0W4E7_9BIVA|nr:hypothetical protein CHS0354_029537 [Potamilus streckersoni]
MLLDAYSFRQTYYSTETESDIRNKRTSTNETCVGRKISTHVSTMLTDCGLPSMNGSFGSFTSEKQASFMMDQARYSSNNYHSDPASDRKSQSSTIPTCIVAPTANDHRLSDDMDERDLSPSSFIPSRKQREFIPENRKDDHYWEKRRKNNEAARKSREKRRIHDMALENRIMDLTRDNCRLRNELVELKKRFGLPLNGSIINSEDDESSNQADTSYQESLQPSTPKAVPMTTTANLTQEILMNHQQQQAAANAMLTPAESIPRPYQNIYSGSAKRAYHTSSLHSPDQFPHTPELDAKHARRDDAEVIHSRSLLPDEDLYNKKVERISYGSPRVHLDPTKSRFHQPDFGRDYASQYWANTTDITSSDSNDEFDQVQEEPLSLVKKPSAAPDNSGSDISNSSASSDIHQDPIPPSGTALPHKLRHKIPQEFNPLMYGPSQAAPQVYISGLTQLSELALAQSPSLSMLTDDGSRGPMDGSDSSSNSGTSSRVSNMRAMYDPKYAERRRKNNEAARKCRENRRTLTKLREAKSEYLESENGNLREEIENLQEEMKQLREMLERKQLSEHVIKKEQDDVCENPPSSKCADETN